MERMKIYGEKNQYGVYLLCLQGDVEKNVAKAREYARFAALCGYSPVIPHLTFCQFLSDDKPDERIKGIKLGIVQMKKCEMLWIFGTEREVIKMIFKHMLRINFMNAKLKIKMIGGFSVKIGYSRISKSKKVLVIRVKLRKILQIQVSISFRNKHR